jgi:hypothetical protein
MVPRRSSVMEMASMVPSPASPRKLSAFPSSHNKLAVAVSGLASLKAPV